MVAPESMLLHNLSVTGLYELELRPHLNAKQRVATVRLRYRSVTKESRGAHAGRLWQRSRARLGTRLAPPPPSLPWRSLGRISQRCSAHAPT